MKLAPDGLRQMLYRVVRAARKRKALEPDRFPFGIVSMDGRGTSTKFFDDEYAQVHHPSDSPPYAIVRTITSALISTPARPCLDAHPIPADTNEMGVFPAAFDALVKAYGTSLFRVAMYDSGANSKSNGAHVKERGFDYVFRLQNEQPTLLQEAERLLGRLDIDTALTQSTDLVGGKVVTRCLWLTDEIAGYNECHNAWDRIFREDDRPWVYDPKGMVATMIIRRIAYTLMTLFRTVTQRSDAKRAVPWKTLMRDLWGTLTSATEEQLDGLRVRRVTMAAA